MKPLLLCRSARPRWRGLNTVFRNSIARICTRLSLNHLLMLSIQGSKLSACSHHQTIPRISSVSGDSHSKHPKRLDTKLYLSQSPQSFSDLLCNKSRDYAIHCNSPVSLCRLLSQSDREGIKIFSTNSACSSERRERARKYYFFGSLLIP